MSKLPDEVRERVVGKARQIDRLRDSDYEWSHEATATEAAEIAWESACELVCSECGERRYEFDVNVGDDVICNPLHYHTPQITRAEFLRKEGR